MRVPNHQPSRISERKLLRTASDPDVCGIRGRRFILIYYSVQLPTSVSLVLNAPFPDRTPVLDRSTSIAQFVSSNQGQLLFSSSNAA
eukprot:g7787.t1